MLHYRVHYDGWNKRYDEWIRKERIVGVVEELVEPPKKIKPKTPGMKAKVGSSRKLVCVLKGVVQQIPLGDLLVGH